MRNLRILWRLVVLGCMLVIIALTLLLWDATGRAGYTKLHDAERAERDAKAAEGSMEDLFAETGIGTLPALENRFQLGLAPSGPGAHAAAVLTIAGPASVVAAGSIVSFALLVRRRPESRGIPIPRSDA